MGWETSFVYSVQQTVFSTSWMIAVAVFMARWLIYVNIIPAAVLASSKDKRERHAVTEAFWSAAFAIVITTVIAFLVQHERPFIAFPDITLLIPPPLNTSFPSGHTAIASAASFAFFRGNRLAGAFAFLIVAFVAMGRMAAGVHFPSDILGGLLVGALSFTLVRAVHRDLWGKRSDKKP